MVRNKGVQRAGGGGAEEGDAFQGSGQVALRHGMWVLAPGEGATPVGQRHHCSTGYARMSFSLAPQHRVRDGATHSKRCDPARYRAHHRMTAGH